MLDKAIYDSFVAILKSELVPALGCTEPIAIAYAAAKARDVLGLMPEKCTVGCSGNMVKNVMGVTVPNSGGSKGIKAAAILGILGGDAQQELAVLEPVTEKHREVMRELLKTEFCSVEHVKGVPNLYIMATVEAAGHKASVEISDTHTNITRITKDGEKVFSGTGSVTEEAAPDKSMLSVRRILDFADEVRLEDVQEIIDRQIECNSALSDAGLSGTYGAQVGKTIIETRGDLTDVIIGRTAAGSDARMNGCALPAIINSGSGNQGITVSVPVIEYARQSGISHERLVRALVVSNLTAIHQKRFIGSLSAYCGASSAACGAAVGIAYLQDCDYAVICDTITNMLGVISGMVCDGAKSSCAAKIAAAVSTAIISLNMAKKNRSFCAGDGIIKSDVEKTVRSVGRLARDGMQQTDEEIIAIMIEQD